MADLNDYIYLKDTVCWLSNNCVLKVMVGLQFKQKIGNRRNSFYQEYSYHDNSMTNGIGVNLSRTVTPTFVIEFLKDKDKAGSSTLIYPNHILWLSHELKKVYRWFNNEKIFGMINDELVVLENRVINYQSYPIAIQFIPSIIGCNECKDIGVLMRIGDQIAELSPNKIREWIYIFNQLDLYTYASTMINFALGQSISSQLNSLQQNQQPQIQNNETSVKKFYATDFFNKK